MAQRDTAQGQVRHTSWWLASLGLAVALTATPLSAQPIPDPGSAQSPGQSSGQAADLDTLSLEQLLDVEVQSVFGASKFLQRITDAPAAVSVVTAEEIERYGWRTLADVLRSVRGFYVTDDRTYSYVGSRGFLRPGDYTTRVLVLIDGHRSNDNVFDQALIQEDFQIDVRDVERIEIIRGPSSSLYGSSAFLGVVNVVTRTPQQGQGVEVLADAGALGHRHGRVKLSRQLGSGLGLAFSASVQRTAGNATLYYPEFDSADSNFGTAVDLDSTLRRNLLAKVQYGSLKLTAAYNLRERGVPTAAYGMVFNDPRAAVSDRHWLVNAMWERPLARGWTGRFRGGFDAYQFIGTYPYEAEETSARPVAYKDQAVGDWLTGEAQLSRAFARHILTVGMEHRNNVRQNQFSYIEDLSALEWRDDRRSSTTALYLQDEFRVHRKLLLNGGVRYDAYEGFDDPIKPRFAAIFQPDERTAVKFLYGEAFRAPNVFESYYIIPGLWKERPGLRPEDIRTTEVVLERYYGRRLRLSTGVFRYDVDELIDFTTDRIDGKWLFANLDAVSAAGFEAEVDAKWPSGAQARASYTFSRARNSESDDLLSNSPAHMAQGLVAVPVVGPTFLGLDLQVLGSRLTRSSEVLPSYTRANLTYSGKVADRLRFAVITTNLFDKKYSDPVGDDFLQEAVLQNGRAMRVELTWSF